MLKKFQTIWPQKENFSNFQMDRGSHFLKVRILSNGPPPKNEKFNLNKK